LCRLAGFGAKRRSRGHPATWSGRMPPDMFLNCNEEIKRKKEQTIGSRNRLNGRDRDRSRDRKGDRDRGKGRNRERG